MTRKSTELDAVALAIARELFGKTPQLTKCYSEVNYCVRLSFDDETSDRVIKLSNLSPHSIEVEAYLYPRLHTAGVPVPEVEFTHEDHPIDVGPFIVMPKYSDYTMVEFCSQNTTEAMRAARSSGQFIRDLHPLFWKEYEDFLTTPGLGAQKLKGNAGIDKGLDFDLIRDDDPALYALIEKHFANLARPGTRRLIHGQPHLRNVLANDRGEICVVDFGDSIGMGCPLRDLYWLLISHDGWGRGTGDPDQRAAIIEGYGGIEESDQDGLAYWESYYAVIGLNRTLRKARDLAAGKEAVSDRLLEAKDRIRTIIDGRGFTSTL